MCRQPALRSGVIGSDQQCRQWAGNLQSAWIGELSWSEGRRHYSLAVCVCVCVLNEAPAARHRHVNMPPARTNEWINHGSSIRSQSRRSFVLPHQARASNPGWHESALLDVSVERLSVIYGQQIWWSLLVVAVRRSSESSFFVVVSSVDLVARSAGPHTHIRPAGRRELPDTRGTGLTTSSSAARQYMRWQVECFVCRRRLQLLAYSHQHRPPPQSLLDPTKPPHHSVELRAFCQRTMVQTNTYQIEIAVFNAASQ